MKTKKIILILLIIISLLFSNFFLFSVNSFDSKKEAFIERNKSTIDEYKAQYLSILEDKIDQISLEKIETIYGKVNQIYEKTEKSTKLSKEKKWILLSKIIALQDILVEQLEKNDYNISKR